MASPRDHPPPPPRYRIERAPRGYRVVGEGLLIWEPTLGEAVERREELEARGWRHLPLPVPEASASPEPHRVIYGPIRSRRLGRSLGIDLTPPGTRACSFDCVYCEVGRAPRAGRRSRWPPAREVGERLALALDRVRGLDSITLSGHGEPTLHPRFEAVIDAVLGVARRRRPATPVRILTNGSRAFEPRVRQALDRLDERIVKLDADPERVNRPAPGAPLGALLHTLTLLRDVSLQACFVEGAVSNVSGPALAVWIELVRELRPRRLQIYTIDRPSAALDARPVSAARLEEIACLVRARSGIEAEVYA